MRFRKDVVNPDSGTARVLRSVVLGDFRTRRDAQREASRYLQRINSTSYRPKVSITLQEYWERYVEPTILPMHKHSTQHLYRILTTRHLLPTFGNLPINEVSPFQVQQFIQQKHVQGYSHQTLAHLRNLLSKFFRIAIRWGWIDTNPAHGVELPPMERRRKPRVITLDEIQRLRDNLTDPGRTIFLVAALCGLRVCELLALRVEDVDLEAATISVRQSIYNNHISTPKTRGSERQIPISKVFAEAIGGWLRVRPAKSEWLFPSQVGTPLNNRNVLYRHIWPVCDRLGIARFRWHALRHTFSTYQGNEGVPTPVLQSLLGHAHANTTMMYTHPLREAKREAVERLAGVLFPIVPTFGKGNKTGSKLIQ
ncbi:MAG TPA: tyrosine-type recombinase/integrase [Terriglobia bacterium]|nr:tyrosine-type recombinase/integrase [Terriglobia bacterium]